MTSEGKTPEAERPVLEAGQVWRSLVLRDYSVRLRPVSAWWSWRSYALGCAVGIVGVLLGMHL